MQFTGDKWLDFFINILAGVTLIVAGKLCLLTYRMVQQILKAGERFSLSGIWVAPCKLPTHPETVEALEIYRLVVRGERVKLAFFHYLPEVTSITKYTGEGIYRGNVISAFYYVPRVASAESGVFVVELLGEILQGTYTPNVPKAHGKAHPAGYANFIFQRIQLPLWRQMLMLLGRPPFKTHQQLLEYCQKLGVEIPKPEAVG